MQHTNELQERRESDGRKQRTHKPADCPSVWRYTTSRLENTTRKSLLSLPGKRALCPHRACSVSDTPREALLQEPLFFNPRIRGPECGAPLTGVGWRPVAEAGVRRVGDLRRLLTDALPPGVSSGQRSVLLAALPQVWRAALNSNINLDSLEWLLSAAAPGDAAAWRRSAAPPGAGAPAPAPGGNPTPWRAPPAALALPRCRRNAIRRQTPARRWSCYGTLAAHGTCARAPTRPLFRPEHSPT